MFAVFVPRNTFHSLYFYHRTALLLMTKPRRLSRYQLEGPENVPTAVSAKVNCKRLIPFSVLSGMLKRLTFLTCYFLFHLQIDVYSFGLLLCEMCIRELPVPHQTRDQISLITDRDFRDLVMSCVRQDPGERSNMAEVISELERMERKS